MKIKNNTIFFDIRFGASGDMLLASLVDAGLSLDTLKEQLSSINLPAWSFEAEKISRHHFSGTRLAVHCSEESAPRTISDIEKIIESSALSSSAKRRAMEIFALLARAEGTVHGIDPGDVHFHEVGAADSILDIAGFCAAMDILNVDEIFYNSIPLSQGSVASQHGRLPLPSPAVLELSKELRVVMTDAEGELITPTAMAILKSLGTQIKKMQPSRTLIATGTGFGGRDYGFPSYTRALLMRADESQGDILMEITCSIDDMEGELYPYISEKLFQAGALDVYLTPLVMKKGRPGILLTALCETDRADDVKNIIFRETTTIGVRSSTVWREKLPRHTEEIMIEGFPVRMKISKYSDEIISVKPEYEDIKKIAEATGIPVRKLMQKAMEKHKRG